MEESEVLFKNTSKMNSEEVTVFQNFALKKLHLIVSIGFSLVFVAIGLLLIFFVNLTAGNGHCLFLTAKVVKSLLLRIRQIGTSV